MPVSSSLEASPPGRGRFAVDGIFRGLSRGRVKVERRAAERLNTPDPLPYAYQCYDNDKGGVAGSGRTKTKGGEDSARAGVGGVLLCCPRPSSPRPRHQN